MRAFTFIENGACDWCGLYDDDKLLYEGHSLYASELGEFVGDGPYTLRCLSGELTEWDDYLISHGGCPKTTAEALRLQATEVGG